jgi:prophage regulatory protein
MGQGGAERYLTQAEVQGRYQVSRTALWSWRRAGRFPEPLELVPRCLRWRESDLARWEASRAAARRSRGGR